MWPSLSQLKKIFMLRYYLEKTLLINSVLQNTMPLLYRVKLGFAYLLFILSFLLTYLLIHIRNKFWCNCKLSVTSICLFFILFLAFLGYPSWSTSTIGISYITILNQYLVCRLKDFKMLFIVCLSLYKSICICVCLYLLLGYTDFVKIIAIASFCPHKKFRFSLFFYLQYF